MRKFLYALGAFAAVLVVAVAIEKTPYARILLFALFGNGAALDAESKAYVDDAVVAITAHWSRDELMLRATPHLRQVKSGDLQALFDSAATALGPLVDYEGAKGGSVITATAGSGTTISATYIARAKFQKGEANFQLTLLKINGSWQIDGFYIGSSALFIGGRRS